MSTIGRFKSTSVTPKFRSLTVLPGALTTIRCELPPLPARQSIVIALDKVGFPKKPASTHEMMPPSAALAKAPEKLEQAVVGLAQLLLSLPAEETYTKVVWAFACGASARFNTS